MVRYATFNMNFTVVGFTFISCFYFWKYITSCPFHRNAIKLIHLFPVGTYVRMYNSQNKVNCHTTERTYVCREKLFRIIHKDAYGTGTYVFYKIISKKNNSITEVTAQSGQFFLNHFFTYDVRRFRFKLRINHIVHLYYTERNSQYRIIF